MLGAGRAVVSTASWCHCLNRRPGPLFASSFSLVPALHVQITRQQPKWPLVPPVFFCSSHSKISPRISSFPANLGKSSSSSSCALSLEMSSVEESVEGDPFSSATVKLPPGGVFSNAMEVSFALCMEQSAVLRGVVGWGIGSFVLGGGGTALAEVIGAPATSEGTQSTDYLLTVLFISAFLGLAILTIGVIYLSVSDFLENRQRKAMQKAAGEEESEKQKKSETARVGNPKGFGVPKVEKKSEKGK